MGPDPALLLRLLPPRLCCCAINKDSRPINSSVLSQGDASASEQRWHQTPNPITKPIPSPGVHPHTVRHQKRGQEGIGPSLQPLFGGSRGRNKRLSPGFNCELVEVKETLSGRLPHRKLLRRTRLLREERKGEVEEGGIGRERVCGKRHGAPGAGNGMDLPQAVQRDPGDWVKPSRLFGGGSVCLSLHPMDVPVVPGTAFACTHCQCTGPFNAPP